MTVSPELLVEFMKFIETKTLIGMPQPPEDDGFGGEISGGYGTPTDEERLQLATAFLGKQGPPKPKKNAIRLRVTATRGHMDPEDMTLEETFNFSNIHTARAFIRGINFAVNSNHVRWENVGKTKGAGLDSNTYDEWRKK